MDFHHEAATALKSAVAGLLRPLFRVLLRHSMSYGEFEALARRVFVDVAMSDFRIEGKKPSISRAAILSGLTRKEVQRLVSEPVASATEIGERFNRAVRVLNGWLRDRDFSSADGQPRVLDIEGENGFAALVRRHSGDVPTRAVLDELVRAGAVRRRDGEQVELAQRGYVPQHSLVDKLGMLGTDTSDLIDTIGHNLEHGANDPRFQRKVMYHSVPQRLLPAFRKLSVQHSQALLERLDHWLHARVTDDDKGSSAEARVRLGVGIYHFEETVAAPGKPGATP
jgi:hypothetical protein